MLENLLASLQRGPLDAPMLCRLLNISQPTLSRVIARAGEAVIRTGKARASRYMASRPIDGQRALPVFRISATGQLAQWAQLLPVQPEPHTLVRFEDGRPDEYYEGLPWWLQDMRPQGFLGRAWVHAKAATLGFPPDLKEWGDNHVLRALAAGEQDGIGNILIGSKSRAAWLAHPEPALVNAAERTDRYVEMAAQAMKGETAGSSAGGEQPKFACAVTENSAQEATLATAVLVKFSVNADNPSTQRWRDLLLAEHIALDTLRQHGLPAAESTILDVGVQRFLEVRRFDRCPNHGRCGVVSLATLDAEFIGHVELAWPALAMQLAERGRITLDAAATAGRFYAFGQLIGNIDMHHGNLAFLHDDHWPLAIAPCYDMLPMAFAPDRNGIMQDALPTFVVPQYPAARVWQETLAMARRYWLRLAQEPRLSEAFRLIASRQKQWLDELNEQLQRLL